MTPKKKIPIQLANPEAKEIWEAVLRANAEVADWPSWKRGQPIVADESAPRSTEPTDPRDD